LAIIGEAVNEYLKTNANNSLENSGQIIAFRNWLVHAYDAMDDTLVLAILKKHLPVLQIEVSQKL
jgi:uncharacterized protein YutE (UPF0331/DUF86 family)